MADKKPTVSKQSSMRLSEEGKRLQVKLSEKLGISQRAVLELAIRELAEKKSVK